MNKRKSSAASKKRSLKWTDYVPWNGDRPEDSFIVCAVQDNNTTSGSAVSEKLDVVVAALNDQRVPVIRSLPSSFYAGCTLELLWKDKFYAYPVMDALLRSGFTVLTQTRMAVRLQPEMLNWYSGTFTPKMLEQIHIHLVWERIKLDALKFGYLVPFYGDSSSFECPLIKAIVYNTCNHRIVYSHPNTWITKEGRALVAWILEAIPTTHVTEHVDNNYSDEMQPMFRLAEAAVSASDEMQSMFRLAEAAVSALEQTF